MPAIKLNIIDTDEDIPRSGRAGLDIPPVLLDAVRDAYEHGKTKTLTVPEDQKPELDSLLRAIQNRYGYQISKGSRTGKKAGTKDIYFSVPDFIDPDVTRAAQREARQAAARDADKASEQGGE